MTQNIITRVGYCPICEKSRNPRTGQKFLAFGTHTQQWHVKIAYQNGVIGMTPHTYKAKINGQNVIVEISCAMYGCGCERRIENNGWFYFINPKSYRREIWTINRWNSLVLYKHDADYEI